MDQFLGSGTTLVEAKLLGRNAIGLDVNEASVSLSEKNTNFQCNSKSKIFIRCGNALNLDFLKDESIDLICTHPPYANIIMYSENIENDMSRLDIQKFMECMIQAANESYRVLKAGKICCIMLADIRKKGRIIPLAFNVMQVFVKTGFILKEIIIKEQHNCRSSVKWQGRFNKFLLLAHEYIFILEKSSIIT